MNFLKNYYKKYKNLSAPAKSTLWFTFCNLMNKGISIITVPIFTRILTTEQYGTYSIYLSWLSILIIFTSLNLYLGVFNNAMFKFENDRDRYISSMQGITIVLTFIYFIVYIVNRDFWNALFELSTLIMVAMFFELLVTPTFNFWAARNRFEYKYKIVVVLTLVKCFLNPLVGIIAVLAIRTYKAEARIVSIVVVEFAICGAILIYQFLKGKRFFIKKYWQYALWFNIPLLPHFLSGTILNHASRVMISKMVDLSAAGIYTVAYNIGMLMQLVTTAIVNSFIPWIYTNIRDKKYLEIRKTTNILMAITASMIILMMFFAPELVRIFAPRDYYEAIYVIPPVAASTFFLFCYQFFVTIEFYFEEKKFIVIASIVVAILNIFLNYIFIPLYGYKAAGYTTLLCYVIFGVSHYFFSVMILKKWASVSSIYDGKIFGAISVLMIISSIVMNFLYKIYILRYGIAIIIIVVMIIKRKNIILQTKKIL